MNDDMSVGERIRYWRNRRQLSQATLAGLVDRSTSWVEKVERGDLAVDKVSVLLALANVLKIGLGDLIGAISLPPNGGQPHDPPKGIHALRRALLVPPDRDPPTAMRLRADVDRVGRLVAAGSYEAEAFVLPGVLVTGRAAAEHDVEGAWSGLARLYQMASGLLRRIGETDLGLVAADRAVSAARRSGDELMVATAQRRLALARLREGWLDDTAAVCSDAADQIAPTDSTSAAGWSMWGSLLLTQAVAAARKDDSGDARRLLRAAQAAAERVGPGRNDYWECFGPTNVGAHEIAIALEMGNPVEALEVANRIDVGELPMPPRRAEVLIDIAHARLLRHDKVSAVGDLVEAEGHAPQAVRYSVKAREIVRVLLKREPKSRIPGLRGLAERLKVTV